MSLPSCAAQANSRSNAIMMPTTRRSDGPPPGPPVVPVVGPIPSSHPISIATHPLSSLDSNEIVTRSIRAPAHHAPLPPATKLGSSSISSSTAARGTTLPLQPYQVPAKAPWQSHPPAPLASVVPPVVPVSGLGAALQAQKQQALAAAAPAPSLTLETLSPTPPSSATLLTPAMQRGESMPSSSGSAASLSEFGSGTETSSPLASASSSSHNSPLSSPAAAAASGRASASSLSSPPPCPLDLWFGVEDSSHARCVLNEYARKLKLYTQQLPGHRQPLEFIGRVRRDRIDVAKLHRLVDARNHPRQRYSSSSSSACSVALPCSASIFLRKNNSVASPAIGAISPSSSPCFKLGLGSFDAPPNPLDSLPATGSFATLDLVSVYSRDALPLGQAFPLIRHEWVCSTWNAEDGIAESIVPLHTEYEQAPLQPGEEEEEDEPEEEAQTKAILQLFAKCVAKPTNKRTKHSHAAAAAAASAASAAYPHALSASITSCCPSAASASSSAAAASSSLWHPASSSPCFNTSFLYCLPIFSEDVTAGGSYDTFGCRAERDTGSMLASLGQDPRAPAATGSSACQAGSVATVGDRCIGYSGSQNSCIFQCMQLLRPSAAAGGAAAGGIGNGSEDTAGEAHCGQTVIDHELEMCAIAAAMAAAAAQAAAATTASPAHCASPASSTSSASSSSSSSPSRDTLDDVGEDLDCASRRHGLVQFGQSDERRDDDDDDELDDDEAEEEADEDSTASSSASDSDDSQSSCSDDSDDCGVLAPRTSSASQAVAIKSSPAKHKQHQRHQQHSSSDDDDDDSFDGAHCSSFGGGSSFASSRPGSIAAGSLGDELAAQLAALGCKSKPAAAASKAKPAAAAAADASDDDDDNFYDANEYQAAHGSSPTAPAHTQHADASAAATATAATNSDAAEPAAAQSADASSTATVAASLSAAAAAPSPDSVARSILATKAAHAALRVAPPTPTQQQTATTAPAGISIDTGSTPQPTGSPAVQPQSSPTNASISSSASGSVVVGTGSVAPAPSRPPRPSYSVPGSAGTTPQSVVRPLPPGSSGSVSKNNSPNVTLTGPILPTAARPTTQQPAAATAAASTTASPHGTREPSASSTTAAASASASAAAPAAASSPPPPFTIKNLDTGETCDLQEASAVFPEVNRAMTLERFEAAAAAAASAPAAGPSSAAAASSSATPASTTHPSGSEPKVSVEEVAEKKKTLGFLSRIKQALHIKDSGDEGAAGAGADKLANQIKVKTRHKSYSDFTDLKLIQTLSQHAGPIWTVSVSAQGDYIATGGQDSIVRVWAVMGTAGAREVEEKLRNATAAQRANQEAAAAAQAAATAAAAAGGSIEVTAVSGASAAPASAAAASATASTPSPLSPSDSASSGSGSPIDLPVFDADGGNSTGTRPVVYPVCFRSYAGHKADVIDLAWSKANFLLSASIDKTVRLWHVSRQKCLCVFQHADFVTAVNFHPIEDRYFVSGSFDKKLRIWNIPEHRVVEWAQTSNIITAATFNPNGSMTVAGLYNGQAVFYQTDGLKYVTQIDCRNRRGSNRKGKKVTGMQFAPDGKSLLITTNDSRIRLYDMDDYSMLAKFKAGGVLVNDELQIRAWFSQDGKHVICGGENQQVVIWSAAEYHASTAAATAAAAAAAAAAEASPISGASAANGHAANGSPLSPGATLASNSSTPSSSAAAAAAAAAALPKPDIKCDSSESFRAFGDTCTSAQFLPSSTIRLSVGPDDDHTKIKHLIVAAGYQGDLKFFENRGLRKNT